MYCPKCGSKINNQDKFCGNCGQQLKKEKQSEVQEKTKEIDIRALKEVENSQNSNFKTEEKNINGIIMTTCTCIVLILVIVLLLTKNNQKTYLLEEEKISYCNSNYESNACQEKDSNTQTKFESMDFSTYDFNITSSKQDFYNNVIKILEEKSQAGNNYCNDSIYTNVNNKLKNTLNANYSYLCGVDTIYLDNLITRLNSFYLQNNIQENIVDAYVVGRGGRNEYANYTSQTIGSNQTYTAYLRRVHMSDHMFGDYDKLKKTYERDLEQGYHPKNSIPEDIIVHETAHALDFYISAKKNNIDVIVIDDFSKYNEFYISWGEQTYSKEVVEKAVIRVNEKYKSLNLPERSEEELRQEISGYAATSKNGTIMYAETFAEALVDYLSNGQNASVLSIEIYKIVQEDLQKI